MKCIAAGLGNVLGRWGRIPALIALLYSVGPAQWVQTNGPSGGSVSVLVANGLNIFAGTGGAGIFRSTNGGTNWTSASTGLSEMGLYVNCLAISVSNIFAGTFDGIFLSTDNGTNWTPMNAGITTSKNVTSLAVSGTDIYAGVYLAGIFRSTDNGTSWVSTGWGDTEYMSFAVMGTILFAGSDGGGIHRSTNNGANWTRIDSGLANFRIRTIVSSGSRLFAGSYMGGLYLSADSGTSWTSVNSLTGSNVTALGVSSTGIFATTNLGVFFSSNNGTSWADVSAGLIGGALAYASSGSTMFAAGLTGVYSSTNDGASWSSANTGLVNTVVQCLTVSGGNLVAGASGNVFLSSNSGGTWTAVATSGVSPFFPFCFAESGQNLFLGGNDIFLSTDHGVSWTEINKGISGSSINALAVSGTNIYAGTDPNGVFLSTNNGGSWTPTNTGLPGLQVRFVAASGTKLFASIYYNNGIYVSTDNGTSWAAVSSPPTRTMLCFASIGANLFAGTEGGGVFVSTDSGSNWSGVNNGLSYGYNTTLGVTSLVVGGTNLYAGTGYGVFLSSDSGKNWIPVNNGLTNGGLTVSSLTLSGATLYAGTNSGVFATQILSIIPPAAPKDLVVTDSVNGSIIIKWCKNTDPDFLRYQIYQSTSPSPTTKVGSTASGNADTSQTLSGLTNGIRYYFRVTAVDSVGNESGYSNEVSAVPIDRIAPAPPTNLVITDSSKFTVTIKWRKSTEADFSRYRIYRNTSPAPSILADSTNSGAADTSKTYYGLTNGVRYYFRVTAVDSAFNESGYSNEINAVAAYGIFPSTPQGLVVFDTLNAKIGIKWQKNTETDFQRYRIYRGTSPNSVTAFDSALARSDTSRTYFAVFGQVTNGVRYYFRVTAVNSYWYESGYSNVVNAATRASSGVDDNAEPIPKDYSLSQNYPNPFNPSTIIRYGLPERSTVKLEIYDLLGRLTETLVDREQDAKYFGVTWQSNVPSGIYFYRIAATASDNPAKHFVRVRKMILLR